MFPVFGILHGFSALYSTTKTDLSVSPLIPLKILCSATHDHFSQPAGYNLIVFTLISVGRKSCSLIVRNVVRVTEMIVLRRA